MIVVAYTRKHAPNVGARNLPKATVLGVRPTFSVLSIELHTPCARVNVADYL